MDRRILLTVLSFLVTLSTVAQILGPCKVLVPKIGDSYTGECKNGLAHGTGESFGIDQYSGDFRKGYPHGIGTYIWHTGDRYEGEWDKGLRDGYGVFTMKYQGRDSIVAGVWKKDVFLGEEELPDYAVTYRQGVGRVTCIRMGNTPNYVKFKFSRSGEASGGSISDLLLTGSSGAENITDTLIGFENTEFPFEGRVRFSAPNAFYSSMLSCEVRFVINRPGAWTVTIYY